MKVRSILFGAPMVQALLAGTKTQTRRLVRPQPDSRQGMGNALLDEALESHEPILYRSLCPYGQPGDQLWVRESGWERPARTPKMMREGADTWEPYYYDADRLSRQESAEFKEWGFKRRPLSQMPRWASRITLEITDVRVERLQSISEDDAKAEGATGYEEGKDMPPPDSDHEWSYRASFRRLWEQIYGPGSWGISPWVWAIEFRRIK